MQRKGGCSSAARCGPRAIAARRSNSSHGPMLNTTSAPRCLYWRSRRRARCATSDKDAKSPRPRHLLTNSVQPCFRTSFASQRMYSPRSSGSSTCWGRGIRGTRLGSGWTGAGEHALRRFLTVGSEETLAGRGVVARVLADGAGFVAGTGSSRFAPLPMTYSTGSAGAGTVGIARTAHPQSGRSCSRVWGP